MPLRGPQAPDRRPVGFTAISWRPRVGPHVAYVTGATAGGWKDDMMTIFGCAVMILLVGALVALAGETAGKIQSVDPADRAVVLDDGTKLWMAEGLPLDDLKQGARIKASYEERDGRNIVTAFEVE